MISETTPLQDGASKTIVSPASTGIVSMKDTGISKYVEFPADTFFMESMSQNASYQPGVAFVPVQRMVEGQVESHIYTMTASSTEAEHFCGPLTVDGSTDLTIFGSALSSDGILYMCAFNRNSIIAIDCKNQAPESIFEIPNLPSPNDVALDPADESILYVAGGTFRKIGCGCCCEFSNSAYGVCYKVQLLNNENNFGEVTIQAEGLRTLAGVEKIGPTLWLAELFRMTVQDTNQEKTIVWEGNTGTGDVWMADNVDMAFSDWMLFPAYATQSETVVKAVMDRNFVMSMVLFYYQVSTAFMKGESFLDAIQDPEVALSFSNTYISEDLPPAPIKLAFMKDDQAFHFEVDLEETRANHEPREITDPVTGEVLGKRHFFNDQVTHAGHLVDPDSGTGFVACVNFEQPRILLLSDEPFQKAMFGKE